jgi:hypothetical protein
MDKSQSPNRPGLHDKSRVLSKGQEFKSLTNEALCGGCILQCDALTLSMTAAETYELGIGLTRNTIAMKCTNSRSVQMANVV